MPYFVISKVTEALNSRGKSLQGASVLVLGIAYKKDIDDDRESPSLKLLDILKKQGARLRYNDPHIPQLKKTRKYDYSNMRSVKLTGKLLKEIDLVLIATDHSDYDYDMIAKHAQLIVDTRNTIKITRKNAHKIFQA